MALTKEEKKRLKAKVFDDAGTILMQLTNSSTLQFGYLSNRYASQKEKDLYRREMDKLAWSLMDRAHKLSPETV